MSSIEQLACEDLKAFERRLTEIVAGAQPSAIRWRAILVFVSLCVAVGAYYWLGDTTTAEVPLMVSLVNHPFFCVSCVATAISFLFGAHRRVVAPSIFVSRAREVLADLSMDCDEYGKLILKPRDSYVISNQYPNSRLWKTTTSQ